ncbi:SDR family oxidoreductase [Bacillus sp. ISL-40]|uniref:SDR family oxidoreductase n=1 Tax=unclassified Bacillus (in: firmicutes) TaxID=185979 RepID=UPI001BEAD469|nr:MULTISPECIES: SDR family oxidoreductase [unclassified Bacillus (in: firmicutes)]MBT2699269.1 SDR family oxidoreductase [Bacillus sp. ISL-40]MBT2723463.1 SDR family oxidoreductase [Bacillus sp. ISL-46]MBT2739871.1 SDR family oxidoreductase [Bacillus sp. ISL-77]
MKKKTALITGGASGIGKKTALYLAENGYQLVINYRNSKAEAISLANQLTKYYGTHNIAIQGDVSNMEDCIRIVDESLAEFSTVDVLVHNAGPYIHERKKLTDYSFDEWNYILQGNLSAVFYLSKLIIPSMRNQKWGRIITIGYDRVETAPGWIFRSAFAAAKTGVASLTRTIAIEEAEHGITANMVCPGDIINEWKDSNIGDAIAAMGDRPIGRQGTGEDIARVIAFLTDEKSDLITGSIIPVTGGLDVLGKVLKN